MRFGFGTRRRPGRAQTGLGAESLTLPASPAFAGPVTTHLQNLLDHGAAVTLGGLV